MFERLPFLKRLRIYLVVGAVLILALGGFVFYTSRKTVLSIKAPKIPEVSLPTIVNGELVLPPSIKNVDQNLVKAVSEGKLVVNSANLSAIFNQNKLTGIRIVGELSNVGDRIVQDVSPVVRFYDTQNKLVGQKLGHISTSFLFHDLPAGEKTLYDITVDDPPQSDKVEVFFNVVSSSDSAIFDELKIASRSLETKATSVNNSQPSTSSDSAAPTTKEVDYYVASGKIINPLNVAVSDIVVYSWVRNDQGKIFATGQTDFKNDLITPGQAIDFSTVVLPFQNDQTMATYEVSAWGKRYNLQF